MQRIKAKIFPKHARLDQHKGKALIEISVTSQSTESLRVLPEILQWTRTNIGPFDAIVGDYLNRHNYEAFEGLDESSAEAQAMLDGKRLSASISTLRESSSSENFAVISAGSLYTNVNFGSRLAHFEGLYSGNEAFRLRIDEAVNMFITRKRPTKRPDGSVWRHCVAYQLEELVLFELLYEAGFGYLVYSGKHLPVMKEIVSGSLPGVSEILETLTLIELRVFDPL